MAGNPTPVEIKAKILLDEANLTFSETAERKDESGNRNKESSVWEEGKMDGRLAGNAYSTDFAAATPSLPVNYDTIGLSEQSPCWFES